MLFSGDFWSGEEAVSLGLVDSLCSLDSLLQDQFGASAVRDYSPPDSLLARLSGGFAQAAAQELRGAFDSVASGWRPVLLP